MGRRAALLVGAVVVAALGTSLIFLYVSRVDDRALAQQDPRLVLVAGTEIPAGTTVAAAEEAGAFEQRALPRDAVVDGALSEIPETIEDYVTLAPIFPGEQVIVDKFGAPGSVSGLPIDPGKIAVSVQLTDPARVAGYVNPGNRVAVFATLRADAAGGEGGGGEFTRLLIPSAKVIGVGSTSLVPRSSSDGESSQQVPQTILTLELDQEEAQKVGYASANGELFLGLLGEGATVDPGEPATDGTNLFN